MLPLLSLLVAAVSLPARAAFPPQHMLLFLETHHPAAASLWEIYAFDPAHHQMRGLGSLVLGSARIAQQAAVGVVDPFLFMLMHGGELQLIDLKRLAPPTVLGNGFTAVAELGDRYAVAARANNELVTIQVNGAVTSYARPGWLDPAQFGQIERLQRVSPLTFVAVTPERVVHFEMTRPHQPVVLATFVMPQWLRLNGGYTIASVRGMVAARNVVWTHLALSQGSAGAADCIVEWNLVTRVPRIWGQFGADIELLDADRATGELIFRESVNYLRLSFKTGRAEPEASGFFDPRVLAAMQAPLGGAGTLRVEHPKSALSNITARGSHPLSNAPLPPHVALAYAQASGAPQAAPAPVPVLVPVIVPAPVSVPVSRKKILDPQTKDDFRQLMTQEMPKLPAKPTRQELAGWLRQANILKYSVGDLSDQEARSLGFDKFGDYLEPIKGQEADAVDLDELAATFAQALARKRCGSKLTQP
jgi:hypothetical protein